MDIAEVIGSIVSAVVGFAITRWLKKKGLR